VVSLVARAGAWIQDALSAWVCDQQTKVAALATIAVEHLGKALLWEANPVLLLPLDKRHEGLLVELVTRPELASPRLRTIGLENVLTRTRRLLGALPVTEERCQRVVNARNGSVHVGSQSEAHQVLVDCLTLIAEFVKTLQHPAGGLYGDHKGTAAVLLAQHKNDVERTVAERMARARHRLTELENQLADAGAFEAATNELETKSRDTADGMLDPTQGAVPRRCPECGSAGMLYGDVDLIGNADWEVEPLGGGHYDSYLVGGWDITLHPRGFFCAVCELHLDDRQELAAAGVSTESIEPSLGELGDAFDPSEVERYLIGDD